MYKIEVCIFDLQVEHIIIHHTSSRLFQTARQDPNQRGAPRYDFVASCVDGTAWRFHPGSSKRQSAIPNFISQPVGAPGPMSGRTTFDLPPGYGGEVLLSFEQAQAIAQGDRHGRVAARTELARQDAMYRAAEPDATEGYVWVDITLPPPGNFCWWRWIANLAQHTHSIVGAGITKCWVAGPPGQLWFMVQRQDGSSVWLHPHEAKLTFQVPR